MKKVILLALFCLALAGCAADTENRPESNALKESEERASEIGDSTEEVEPNSAISTKDLNTWIGRYAFFESCSEPDYPPIMMEFEITIYENGYADIYVNGQTTFIQIRAKVYGSSEQISFVFSERLPGDLTSGEWDSSDVLLYFKKDGDDIYTYWGELKDTVLLYSDQISGEIYFVKTDEETDEEISFGNEFESMMQGDFSAVFGLSDEDKEDLHNMYLRDQERGDMEWAYFDINADGAEELIYQQKEPVSDSSKKRIYAVFAMTANGCERIIWDVNDMGEYHFLADDKIVYYYRHSGVYHYESYSICSFDEMWNKNVEKQLEILLIDDMVSYEEYNWNLWDIVQPIKNEYYYRIIKYGDDTTEKNLVQAEEWFHVFEDEIGEIEKYGPETEW